MTDTTTARRRTPWPRLSTAEHDELANLTDNLRARYPWLGWTPRGVLHLAIIKGLEHLGEHGIADLSPHTGRTVAPAAPPAPSTPPTPPTPEAADVPLLPPPKQVSAPVFDLSDTDQQPAGA